ncbi:MAG: phosphonopyruvate decarboxylase [Victivallales bacterium]|jgi:phosphonopyruvate decarboxylase
MIRAGNFTKLLGDCGIDFFAGVPDSLMKPFCDHLAYDIPKEKHVICANEGAAVGLAMGYHLSTGKIPLVYMQNSGLGNAVNPLLSMADKDVYSIPVLLMIGWRGEPGIEDEPQHKKTGRTLIGLLKAMEIPFSILDGGLENAETSIRDAVSYMTASRAPYALVVRKSVFEPAKYTVPQEAGITLTREEAIRQVLDLIGGDSVTVSTTGMASREIFEYREFLKQGHGRDFLVIGGMGHASQIANGVASAKGGRNVFCIDGDGSAIMHLGSMATTGTMKCGSFYHVILNNGAHDSVGGQPTAGFNISFTDAAKALGYNAVFRAQTHDEIDTCMKTILKSEGPILLEILVKRGNRPELGRPTESPVEMKAEFMEFLRGE